MVIFIEGIDNVGKTTIINNMYDIYNEAVFLRYPKYDYSRYLRYIRGDKSELGYIKIMKKVNKEFSYYLYRLDKYYSKLGYNIFVDRSPISSIVYRDSNDIGIILRYFTGKSRWIFIMDESLSEGTSIKTFNEYLNTIKINYKLIDYDDNVRAYLNNRYLDKFKEYNINYTPVLMKYRDDFSDYVSKIIH